MYRISIVKQQRVVKPTSPNAFTLGYFGPCYKEDVMSPEEIAFFNDRSQWKYISSYIKDNAKVRDFLKEARVGSSVSWANFRHNKKYALIMCQKGTEPNPKLVHFLRPEYAQKLGLSGPIVIDVWRAIDEKSQDLIEENYIPDQRDYTTIRGDVVKVAYTGNVSALIDYQNNLISQGFSPPFSVNVWGKFLEGKKELKLYAVDKKLRQIAKAKSLTPEEKQQKFNQTLEESFYGLKTNERLYKYTGDPKNPKANLEVEHSGKGQKRNISKDGFTLREWKDLVFDGILPAALDGKKLTPEKTSQLLNGVVDSVQRVTSQSKIKYTGDNPHTIEKMALTGLKTNEYYTQNEWCNSIAKVLKLEEKMEPYNIKAQQKYKANPLDFSLLDNYKEALANFDLSNAVGEENVKKTLSQVGAWFRKKLERAGVNDAKNSLKEIQSQSNDTFAIQQFIRDLQNMDNIFIDSCYTKQLGSTGEQVLRKAFSKGLGPDYRYQKTLSINVIPPGSEDSMLLMFDGAILKSNNIVMLFEVQGAQHYAFNKRHFKSYNDFQERLYRDKIKMDFCRQHNIPLFTVSHILDFDEATSIYEKLASSGAIDSFVPKGTKEEYNNSYISEDNNVDWVQKYVDNLVVSHFNPIINTKSYENIIPKIKRIINDLSKLAMIALSNSNNPNMQDISFMQGFSKETLLDQGHKLVVDSFNKYFGDKFSLDYQDNVTYLGYVNKPIEMPKETDAPQEITPKLPTQEMAFYRPKKKYKIRRVN